MKNKEKVIDKKEFLEKYFDGSEEKEREWFVAVFQNMLDTGYYDKKQV